MTSNSFTNEGTRNFIENSGTKRSSVRSIQELDAQIPDDMIKQEDEVTDENQNEEEKLIS